MTRTIACGCAEIQANRIGRRPTNLSRQADGSKLGK